MSKRKQKQSVIDFDNARFNSLKQKRETNVEIIPRNTAQEEYVSALSDLRVRITFALGPAGTGKTLLAVLRAIQALKKKEISRIVITRPAVSVDESHGFLPGDLNAKMEPWTRPISDILEEYWSPEEIATMIADRIIEIAPLAYMRGRTFKNCYIIADEMQNASREQMKMILTRIGSGTRLSVTGDLKQHDRGFEENGLKCFLDMYKGANERISVTEFTKEHVERDPIVADVLHIYSDND